MAAEQTALDKAADLMRTRLREIAKERDQLAKALEALEPGAGASALSNLAPAICATTQ
jgi:histidinol-phosphate/aromatic aminotransferase/cobyric acid decarboxylase-like protein